MCSFLSLLTLPSWIRLDVTSNTVLRFHSQQDSAVQSIGFIRRMLPIFALLCWMFGVWQIVFLDVSGPPTMGLIAASSAHKHWRGGMLFRWAAHAWLSPKTTPQTPKSSCGGKEWSGLPEDLRQDLKTTQRHHKGFTSSCKLPSVFAAGCALAPHTTASCL